MTNGDICISSNEYLFHEKVELTNPHRDVYFRISGYESLLDNVIRWTENTWLPWVQNSQLINQPIFLYEDFAECILRQSCSFSNERCRYPHVKNYYLLLKKALAFCRTWLKDSGVLMVPCFRSTIKGIIRFLQCLHEYRLIMSLCYSVAALFIHTRQSPWGFLVKKTLNTVAGTQKVK